MARPLGLRTWIEVDKKAIAHNYRVFRNLIPQKTKLMSVVKSNAYGHNLIDFAKEITSLGADWLGVDSVMEALALRKNGINTPILILGYTLPEMLGELAKYNVSFAISCPDHVKALKKIKTTQPIRVHLKVESGMNRQGFLEKDMAAVVRSLEALPHVQIEGLFTHFAMAKNPAFPEFVKAQLAAFDKWIKFLESKEIKPIIHAAATGGALLYPASHFDMVRIGIGLYGMWPSNETEAAIGHKIKLRPALTWKTVVGEVKNAARGGRVGYDCTERLERDSKIGICPIGYWHGYPRAFSAIASVLVKGQRARVLGRVSMDMIAIDLTDIKGKVGINEEVVLMGKQGGAELSCQSLASLIDMSHYELITRLNPLIRRIYL